jgi:toxin-antitoxin system PIN domain toxin
VINLLDSNVLIAINVGDHELNRPATAWFTSNDYSFATCAITEGALVRHLMRADWHADDAVNLVALVAESSRHRFWSDDISYRDVNMKGVLGHRQVTDAYLAQLARHHRGRLATFDQGLAALHRDVADLVPTS